MLHTQVMVGGTAAAAAHSSGTKLTSQQNLESLSGKLYERVAFAFSLFFFCCW